MKNVGKESNLSGEKAGRKDKDPSFTEIQGLSSNQLVDVLGHKNDLCYERRPFAMRW